MSQDNIARIKLEGLWPKTPPVEDVRRVFDKAFEMVVATAAATVAQAESILFVARRPCRLRKVKVVGDTQVAPDGTSYANFNLFKRTVTTPGTAVTMLTAPTKTTASSGTGTIATYTAVNLMGFVSSTAANFELDTGDVLTGSITKTAGGVALGTMRLEGDVEELSA